MGNPRHLWLLGLSGSGKSTLGPPLAQALGLPWVDTDSEIVETSGQTIPGIFQIKGEEVFRDLETEVVARIAAGPASVVSCGGGAVLREANRKTMAATGIRIYLRSDPATLARRLKTSTDRPLLSAPSPEDALSRQLSQRAPWYEQSEIQIDVTRLTPAAGVAAIREQLPAPWSR